MNYVERPDSFPVSDDERVAAAIRGFVTDAIRGGIDNVARWITFKLLKTLHIWQHCIQLKIFAEFQF